MVHTKDDLKKLFKSLGKPAWGKEAQAAWDRHVARRSAEEKPAPPLEERFAARIEERFIREIRRRGGETVIHEREATQGLRLYARANGFYLLRVEGWRYYSRRFGVRPAALAYLCGTDDSGDWAVRVPSTVRSIADALNWMMPNEVRKARRRVVRQGDVYAVECAVRHAHPVGTRLGNHTLREGYLEHLGGQHAPVSVPFPCRLVQQRMYAMGRTNRGGSD